MGIGLKLFGGSKNKNANGSASSSEDAGLERALRFAKKSPPQYCHKKKEAIGNALVALERAVFAIDAAQTILEETQSLFQTAIDQASEYDDAKRGILSAQVARLQEKLTSYVESANNDELNLVNGKGSHLVIALSEATTGQLVIRRINLNPSAIGLGEIEQLFDTITSVKHTLELLDRALEYVRTENQTFCANASILAEHYDRV